MAASARSQQSYDQSWGRVKSITRPAVGNHEYLPSGTEAPATDCDPTGNAGGYYAYFGQAAGDPSKAGTATSSAPGTSCCSQHLRAGGWLRAGQPTGGMAVERPGQPSGRLHAGVLAHPPVVLGRAAPNSRTFVQDLYNAGADVILTGHDHVYERFAPQDPNTRPDPNGLRAFVVGTGGKNHTPLVEGAPPTARSSTPTPTGS